jgi:pyridoxal phosphate enzyme (YggS family)
MLQSTPPEARARRLLAIMMAPRTDEEAALRATLARNLARVRERMAEAAARAGRDRAEARLVAVTKAVPAPVAVALAALGQEDLGENRVQDLLEKQAALASAGLAPRLHMIGHLQRNKARAVVGTGALLQSLDSERLAEALEALLEKTGAAPFPALAEVNIAREPQKGGVAEEEVEAFLARRAAHGRIAVQGLMCMAPEAEAGERARPFFARLRALRDRLRPAFPALAELSMGMSQDFEAAIGEGATIVRVGRALFEGLAAG